MNSARQFNNVGKTKGIGPRPSRRFYDGIVTSDFALQIDAPGNPVNDRMKDEYRFNDALQDECIVVAARKVGGFMQADSIEFGFVELLEDARWNQDRGPERTRSDGCCDLVRESQPYAGRGRRCN